jgi:hypothetical protein
MAEGANLPKGEFLSAVIGLKSGLAEFGHMLDQRGQARGKQKLVHPLRLNMHIHLEPFFCDSFQELFKVALIHW